MKNNFFYLFLITITFITNNVNGQKIVAQKSFDIPSLGSNGNQNALYWGISKDDGLIYFYATGHQNGGIWTIGKNDYQAYLTKRSDKNGVGKALDKMLIGNAYQDQVFLNTYELKFDQNLQTKGSSSNYFRTFGPKSDTLLFLSQFGNVVSLDAVPDKITGKEPQIRSHIDNFNKIYKNAPKLNDTVNLFHNVDLKGEGALGLKDVNPWLIKISKVNSYVQLGGFSSEVKQEKLYNLRLNESLKNTNYVDESFYINSKGFETAWFVANFDERKDRRNYKLVCFNNEGEITKTFNYDNESSKKPILSNQSVYDLTGKIVGLVSLFGYDNSSDKKYLNPDKAVLNDFDLLYFDLAGNLKWKSTFKHGDEKDYKNVVKPVSVFDDGKQLVFINMNQKSIFNISYEVFGVNKNGEKQMVVVDEARIFFKKTEYPGDYMSADGKIAFDGENIWMYSFNKEKVAETNKMAFKSMSVMQFDKSYKPVSKKIIPITSSEVMPEAKLISNEIGKLKYYLCSGGTSSILTLSTEKGIENEIIKSKAFDGSINDPFIKFSKPYIIDKDRRTIYLLHEFYNSQNLSNKMLGKILVSKISY